MMPKDIPTPRITTQITFPPACRFVGISLVLYACAAIALIIVTHLDLLASLAAAQVLRAHVLCAGFGMLGAATAAIRKFYSTLITDTTAQLEGRSSRPSDWSFGWCYYYLTRPLLGAILGALTFLLSLIGFHVLASRPDVPISEQGRYLLYAVAFLSGFSVSNVLTRLESIAKNAFEHKRDQTT